MTAATDGRWQCNIAEPPAGPSCGGADSSTASFWADRAVCVSVLAVLSAAAAFAAGVVLGRKTSPAVDRQGGGRGGPSLQAGLADGGAAAAADVGAVVSADPYASYRPGAASGGE